MSKTTIKSTHLFSLEYIRENCVPIVDGWFGVLLDQPNFTYNEWRNIISRLGSKYGADYFDSALSTHLHESDGGKKCSRSTFFLQFRYVSYNEMSKEYEFSCLMRSWEPCRSCCIELGTLTLTIG
jgi:hypothetical protein